MLPLHHCYCMLHDTPKKVNVPQNMINQDVSQIHQNYSFKYNFSDFNHDK